jgi:hypothetical protein
MAGKDDRNPPVVAPVQARSGRRVTALILLEIFWLPVEWHGESTEPDDVAVEEEAMPRAGSQPASQTPPAQN